ncbi:MAG TPA: tetratricopeptide repeat protein, partial [Polyangiaceae bacterium]|nr:tetratricopeptide repeat protein [Polyangiaceae bacterium]
QGPVDGTLTRAGLHSLDLADALEALIAVGADTTADRQYTYQRVSSLEVVTAQDALARALVAGRLAQISGISATSLVAEVERYARASAELDPNFRSGAAQRLLGTLYVMAPAGLLEHGDSEVGLELLQSLAQRFPDHVPNRLRAAEAYLALGDPPPAQPHLCYCVAHRSGLRPDERKLLDELLAQSEVERCP